MDAETICCSLWSFCPKGARCENSGTLRNLRRLLHRTPSSGRFLSFARSGMLAGGVRRENAGTLVARTGRRVERKAEWASKRVALGTCAAVFARIQVWPTGTRRRSLRNALSEGARRETLGRSDNSSGTIRRRRKGKRGALDSRVRNSQGLACLWSRGGRRIAFLSEGGGVCKR